MQYEELHESEHEHRGMMPNGYEAEGGTAMLATNCLICSRPLRDPASLERGVGPICAQRHGMFAVTGEPDMAALARALDEGGYAREDPVTAPGQVARRGGIVDFFPPDREDPVRLEFLGDAVVNLAVSEALYLRHPGDDEGVHDIVHPAPEAGP